MARHEAEAVLVRHAYQGEGTRGMPEPKRSEIKAALDAIQHDDNRIAATQRDRDRREQTRQQMAAAEQAQVDAATAARARRVAERKAEALDLAARTQTQPAPEK